MKTFIYTRVSDPSQRDNTSLESQRKQLTDYCASKGFEIVHHFVDAGVSGGIPIDKRPQGSQMMGRLNEVDAICVLKLCRMFRSTIDCLQTVQELDKQDVALHILDLGGNSISTKTATGMFTISVIASATTMEKTLIKERTTDGRNKRKAAGQVIGPLPFGYDLEGKTLIPNPTEQAALNIIYQMRLNKFTLSAIASKLNNEGYVTKSGRSWNFGTVQSVIRRRSTNAANR